MAGRLAKHVSTMTVLALLLTLVPAGTTHDAHAAAFVVTSTLDTPDAAPGDGLCRTSVNTCTVRAAIQEANAHPGSDEITLPADTYISASASETISGELTITGAGRDATILYRSTDGPESRNGPMIAPGATVTLRHLTLRGHMIALQVAGSATLEDVGFDESIDRAIDVSAGGAAVLRRVKMTRVPGRFLVNGGSVAIDDSMLGMPSEVAHASQNYGSMTIARSAIFQPIDNNGSLSLENVTVDVTGDIALHHQSGVTSMTHTTIKSLAVSAGQVRIKSSILERCIGSYPISLGDNIAQTTTCFLAGPRDRTGVDPLLEPARDNGGQTLTRALRPGSPAIDRADPATCPATDQRRATRPVDGNGDGQAICDIGAFEMGGQLPPPPPPFSPGGGTTIQVTSTLDEPDAAPGDGVCSSVPAGACTLRAAIMEAQARPGSPDRIVLPGGTFALTRAGGNEDRSFVGDLDLTGPISVAGVSADATIIDGSGVDRVFEVTELGDATLSNLTVRNAAANGGVTTAGILNLRDVTISGNQGGGVRASGARAQLTIARSRITDNTGIDGAGVLARGPFTMIDSTVDSNTASGTGGGLDIDPGPHLATIRSSQIVENHAVVGGGIHGRSLAVAASTIAENSADDRGGGLWLGENTTIDGVTVVRNRAAAGGGIWGVGIMSGGLRPIQIRNSTIAANTANVGGGLANDGGIVSLTHTTIAENLAPTAASLFRTDQGTVELSGTIVAGPPQQCAGVIETRSASLETGTSCRLTAPGSLSNTDPQLGSLGAYGGPTLTFALLPGSPAIDAAATASCPTADQRGERRPQDGDGDGEWRCDIGAVEAAPGTTPFVPSSCAPRPPIRIETRPAGAGRLHVTVTSAVSPSTPTNAIHTVIVGTLVNAAVDYQGRSYGSGETIQAPADAHEIAFLVRRLTTGQRTHVPFIVTDGCGNWPSFVGGGPASF